MNITKMFITRNKKKLKEDLKIMRVENVPQLVLGVLKMDLESVLIDKIAHQGKIKNKFKRKQVQLK